MNHRHTHSTHFATGFILFLSVLFLNLFSPLHAVIVMPKGTQIRLAFETRTITAEQAEMIINGTVPGGADETNRWGNHYIDLWTYVYYDKEHFSQYLDGKEFRVQLNQASLSFAIYKNGAVDKSRTVVRIAPSYDDNTVTSTTYPDGFTIKQDRGRAGTNLFYITRGMDDGILGYGAKMAAAAGQAMGPAYYDDAIEIVTEDNKEWYRIKMALLRFVWIKPESFHVNFSGDGSLDGVDAANGSCNWPIRLDGSEPMKACATGHEDWSIAAGMAPGTSCGADYVDCFKLIQGGVEIISGLEAKLSPDKNICPDDPAVTTLTVSRYKNSDDNWDKLKTACMLQYYDRVAGRWVTENPVGVLGSKDDADAEGGGSPYFVYQGGATGNNVSASNLRVQLNIPAAWHGYVRDSLRLVIGLDDPYYLPFSLAKDPHLKVAFTDDFSAWGDAITVYRKTKGVGGGKDIISGIPSDYEVYGIPANKNRYNSKVILTSDDDDDKSDMFSTAYDEEPFAIENVILWYAPDLTTSFESITDPNYDDVERTKPTYITEEGYYYLQYVGEVEKNKTCVFLTDTVYVKPMPTPILFWTTGEDCVAKTGFSVEAANPDGQADGWEWVLGFPEEVIDGMLIGYADPFSSSSWVRIPSNVKFKAGGVWFVDNNDDPESLELTFGTPIKGAKGYFEVADINDEAKGTFASAGGLACWESMGLGDEDEPDYEWLDEDDIGFWPEKNAENEDKGMKFKTTGYSIQYFMDRVFYARYWVGEDTSAWGWVGVVCNDDGILPAAIGVSASGCVATNPGFDCDEVGGSTDIKVEPGDDVTLYCFMNYDQNAFGDQVGGWPITKTKGSWGDLESRKITVYWQVQGSDGVWKTWHTSGYGAEDIGALNLVDRDYTYGEDVFPVQYLYITATRENVTENEKHRVYAVFGTCKVDPSNMPDNQCNDFFYGIVPCDGDDILANYDTECTINVGASKGAAYVDKAGATNIAQTNLSICYGDLIDLELKGATVPAGATITWESSLTGAVGSWAPAGLANNVVVRNVKPNVTDDDGLYAATGKTIYYRASFVAEGKTLHSDSVVVTVKKARKVYIGWENEAGSWCKPAETTGYCAGDAIIFSARPSNTSAKSTRYTSYPTGVTSFLFQKEDQFSSVTSGIGGFSAKYSNVSNGSRYRVVAKNGTCYMPSDTVTIKINPAFSVTVADVSACVGPDGKAEVSLTATGAVVDAYTWGYKNTAGNWVDESSATNATYTRKYPVPGATGTSYMRVTGYKVFGTGDTIHCPYKKEDIKVTTTVCKPYFNLADADENKICAGTDALLAWSCDENYTTGFVCGTDSLFYAESPFSNWILLPSTDYDCEDAVEDGELLGTYVTLKGESTILNTTTTKEYQFKAAKKDFGSRSNATAVLTVNAKPVITSIAVTVGGSAAYTICEGTTGLLQAGANCAPTSGSGNSYTYTWTKDGSAIPGASSISSSYNIVNSGSAVAKAHEGTYKVSAVLTKNGCASDPKEGSATLTVVENPEKPIVEMTNGEACPGAQGTITGTVKNLDTDKYTYIYTWKTSGGANVSNASYVNQSTNKGYPVNAPSSEFYLSVTASTKTTPVCSATSDKPTVLGKVVAKTCDGPKDTTVKACPGDTEVKPFTLVCPSGASTITITTASGATVAGVTISPNPSTSVTSYTVTLPSAPTTKTVYKAKVTLDGVSLTDATLTYDFYELPTGTFTWSSNPTEFCEGVQVCLGIKEFSPNPANATHSQWTWEHNGNVYISVDKPATEDCGEILSTGGKRVCFCNAPLDSAGTYTISTVLTDPTTKCKNTVQSSTTIRIKPMPKTPVIEALPNGGVICSNQTYSFTPTVTVDENADSTTYVWYYTTGTTDPTTSSTGQFKYKTLKICKATEVCSNTEGVNPPTTNGKALKVLLQVKSFKEGCSRESTGEIVTYTASTAPSGSLAASPASVQACAGTDTTLKVVLNSPSNVETETYVWKRGGTTLTTGVNSQTYSSTYKVTGVGSGNAGSYTITDTLKNADGCTAVASTSISLTSVPTPTISGAGITGNNICSGETLSLTANGTASSGTLTYIWYKDTKANVEAGTATAISGAINKTYSVANAPASATGTYAVKITAKAGTCETSEVVEKAVTVVQKPSVSLSNITSSPASPICQGTAITLSTTETLGADNATGTQYTRAWTPAGGTSALSGGMATYAVSPTATATYKYKIDASYTEDSKTCTASAEKDIAITVTTPANLSAIAVTGAVTDKCLTDGKTTLTVTGVTQGNPSQTVAYQWYKDGTAISGATSASYDVSAVLSSNGKYKCKVTVAATANNPCSAENTTAEVDVTYKLCGNEALTPGNAPQQSPALAIICQRGNESSTASVSFNTTIEKAAVTKVTWMKYTTEPALTSTADGTVIKTVNVDASTNWPLTLTHTEVFGAESAPKSYYIRAKIERGSVVGFSTNYRFVKAQNAPDATGISMNETDKVVCKGTAFNFVVSATAPAKPTDAAYTGITTSSEALKYIWTIPSGSSSNTSATQAAGVNTPVTDAAYSAKVVSAYKYTVSGLSNTCYDTAGPVSGKITVKDNPTVSLAISAASACANALPEEITLTATVTDGDVLKWERAASGGKTVAKQTITAAGTTNPYKLAAADIETPAAGGTAVTNTYTVTAGNGVCSDVTASKTFVVNPIPDLASVEITAGTTYCNDIAHTLTATAKTAAGGAVSGTPIYKWEQSSDGTTWTNATGTYNEKNYTIGANKTAGTYIYRCTVTMGSGSCTVEKTSAAQTFKIDAITVAGTLNQPDAVCSDVAEANRPVFTLTGNTGTVQKWEVNTYTVPGNTSTTYTLNPSDASIAALLSTSSRKSTLTVKVTVQNGTVCPAQSTSKTIDIYKKIDNLTLQTQVDECDLSKNTEVTYSPDYDANAGETVLWEYAGGMAQVNLDAVTKTTATSTKGLNLITAHQPKYESDTVYTVRLKISSAYCGDVVSAPVTVKAKRQSKQPAVTASSPVCEGSAYTVTATRPAASGLTWSVAKDGGAAASISTGINTSGQTETYTIAAGVAAPGSYVYTVTDKGCDEGKSATVTVLVNEKPVAGTIEAASGGVFCASGENVVVNHKSGTVKPTTSKINWQVCTDTNNLSTRVSTLEKGSQTNNEAFSNSGFTAGQTYYIRYVVPATESCVEAYSNWVKVNILQAVTAPTLASLGTKCEGDEVTISFTVASGLEYELYSNTANNTTGGTKVKSGTADGNAITHTFAATPNGTGYRTTWYYYVKVTDPNYSGSAGCGKATSAVTTLQVDAKPKGGTLVFDNNGKDTLTANVAEHALLKLSDATGNPFSVKASTQPQGGSFGAVSDMGSIAVGTNKDIALQVAHMEKTMFWVVAANGVCPAANSDTVVVTVKSATDPTLGIGSPICEKVTDATLTINVPETLKGSFDWSKLTWQRRAYTAGMGAEDGWEAITTVNMPSVSGTPTTHTATDPGAKTLAPGTYQYRYHYDYGTQGYSNAATLQIDATSKGGKLEVDYRVVCQEGGITPVLRLVEGDGLVGDIVEGSLKSGSALGSITDGVSGAGTDPDAVYSVPVTAANVGKKIYQLQVKNGTCAAVNSDTVAVEVIEKPVAGSLTVDKTLCFDNGTATVSLGNDHVGSSIVWSTSSSRSGSYTDVPNTDATTYTVGPSTDRIWVKATVNTHAVCTAVSTEPVAVEVYDTLLIPGGTTNNGHPKNVTIVGTGSATFTVAVQTAQITYTDGGTHVAVSAGKYQWYKGDGTKVTDGDDYSGATTATLTVANAENHAGETFYCVVTDNKCEREVQSNSAKITAMEKLAPGTTHSLTECACYYRSDRALYYVSDAAGQGQLAYRWQVSTNQLANMPTTDAEWFYLDETFPDLYATATDKGDSIIFPAIGAVVDQDIHWIRAMVTDEYTTEPAPTSNEEPIMVCLEEKPTYAFVGDTVCSRDGSGAAVPFAFSANRAIQDRKLAYAYRLPSESGFTTITDGKQITVDGKTLSFALSGESLSIPATSAIPFGVDSLIVRVEVRSCYTPLPETNTDTTMYAVLRVDAPVQITRRAPDTIVCTGTDFDMETGFSPANKNLEGNEITARWYQLGMGEKGSKTYPGNEDGSAVRTFTNVQAATADGTWYVDLSTKYCPAVTDSITVAVHKVPAFSGDITPAEVCKGSTATLTATIDATAASDYTLQWQRKNGTSWEDVASATTATLSISNTDVDQAGEYRLQLIITRASCADTLFAGSSVTVRLVPEVKLDPRYKVTLQEDGTRDVTVKWEASTKPYVTVIEPTAYEWQAQAPGATGFDKLTGSEAFVNGNTDEKTLTLVGKKDFDSTLFYAKVTTGCGPAETEKDTLRIFDKFAISMVQGPDKPLCQDNNAEIEVTTTGPATYVEWHVSTDGGATWSPIAVPSKQAGFDAGYDTTWEDASYTLKIKNVEAGMDGFKYRAVVHDQELTWDTVQGDDVVTLRVFSGKSPFSLTIRDATDDGMEDGDVREAHQVVFHIYDTVSGTDGYKQYYDKLCVMRRISKDEAEEVKCVTDGPFTFPLQIPSFTASVEEHDSTLYFVMASNYCGSVASDTNLLRVYDTLIVRWVADTIIYTDKGDEWSVDSLGKIVPGRLIDVYSVFDSTPMQAHVFLCDSSYAIFYDTTLKGFMNTVDMIPGNRNSKWWIKPFDDEWDYADPFEWDNDNNTEHNGYFGIPHGEFFTLEDDGLQIKGWGLNNLYCDSTSVLTIHMLPGLSKGDLKLTPAEISLCESASGNDQTFVLSSLRYTGELWEMAAASYNLRWQYLPDGEEWVDVDSLNDHASWHFGAVRAEHDGWKIRAFASVPCGTDTVEAVIRVTPSLTPVVLLVSDSACLGDTLTFTASTENMGENPVFEWFVDGEKKDANGAQYKVASLAAGEHQIEVRATLADATLCVSPDHASAEEVALVYALPQIKADIADTLMKNIDTTSVWVKGQGSYTYVWTPETGLLDPTADSTLLWGLEPQQEPHVYVVTATDENGCQAKDSVKVRIESNFTLDSIGIVVVVPPVLDLDGGRLPGYPEEPEDSYYPDLGGTPFGGKLTFRGDTVADLWICAHNTALIQFYVRGGEKPISYTWNIDEGNATLVYSNDSVFGIFFPDTSTHTMQCTILDKTGAGDSVTIHVHYYRPEMFYLEVTPKVTSGKYYEQQAMNFFVRPDRDWLTTWVDVRNGEVKDTVTNRKMNRQMSFTKEEGDETSIWISTVDRHGCRIWDSVPIHIIPLPNVLLVGDPINGVIFPEFEVEITNTWGLKVKGFEDRNGNGSSRGWDGRTKSGTYVAAGTYYYRAKIPTLDKKGYMIVNGAVTVVNK